MPVLRNETSAHGPAAERQDQGDVHVRAAAPDAGEDNPQGAPRRKEVVKATRRRRAGRPSRKEPRGALRSLLLGLRAGDLECLLLTLAMAAEENRMPSADPDEAARILAFLARLAEYDTVLPPHPSNPGYGPDGPLEAD